MAFTKGNPGRRKGTTTAAPKPPPVYDLSQPRHTALGWLHRYNVLVSHPLKEWELELHCWQRQLDTGMGGYYHLRRAAELLLPDSEWHPWREERFKALCDPALVYRHGGITIRNLSLVGCGASGKTNDAAVFGFLFWLADPLNSYVILTSTSKTKMDQRAWPVMQDCYNQARNVMDAQGVTGPHMLNSKMMVQAEKGNSERAIFGQAVQKGEVEKAVNDIKGCHAPRMCLIVDEADGTPDAVYATIPNMLKGCSEFVLINSANGPTTHLDTFSRTCEPVQGWSSISVDSERWATKALPEFQLPAGHCLHFDGKRSPNVLAGRTLYPYLYTQENWERVADNPDMQNTAQFWSQERGFWPPAGFSNTVFNEALVDTHGGRDNEVIWLDQPEWCAALDPAFGGDDCVLQFGQLAMAAGRKRVLLLRETVPVPFDPQSTKPIDHQIAHYVMGRCKERGIRAEMFGTDATGIGRGVAAILKNDWSSSIMAVEFGGAASEESASPTDTRPGKEVYANRVTELWWWCRELVVSEQLKGLGVEAMKQFCSRLYDLVSKRYRVESKVDMKARCGRSPDQADAVVVLAAVCRRNGRLDVAAGRGAGSRSSQASWLSLQSTVASLSSSSYGEGQTFSEFAAIGGEDVVEQTADY